MSGYTCPFSRCRRPIGTYEELVTHVDERTTVEEDHSHNVSAMAPEDLAAEVRHLTAANLRLEQSCGYYKEVADSWRYAAEAAAVPVGGESGVQ